MIRQRKLQGNVNYFYDQRFDTINIYLGKATSFFSDEESPGIFLIKRESDEKIIGIEILNYSRRSKRSIKKMLPYGYKRIINEIKIDKTK